MDRPQMNQACVNKCVKGGTTRSKCMAQCYPDKGGKSSKKSSRTARKGSY